MFLKNAWYVAAWSHELGDKPLAIKVLGEHIVLYRKQNGAVAALEDACPHRKLPLSMGRIKGDQIECGYHGLTFDCTGSCTRAPSSQRIPTLARVRAYAVEERYRLIWIWMGAAEEADPAKIIDVAHWGDPSWGVNQGDSMSVACNYLYVTDNLLDPSHVAWVHQTSFAGASCEDVALHTDVAETGVTVWRWMKDVPPAPFYAPFLRFSGNCDRKQQYEVRFPAHAIIKAILVPAGSGDEGSPLHPDAFVMDSYNFMTPVDAHNTRYYWFQMRNFAPGDAAVSQQFTDSVRMAFAEDKVVLEAVHEGMAKSKSPELSLQIDVGPLRFRRKLGQMIAAEEAAQKGSAAQKLTAIG
jgi:vanillate O-demethylase monooxygenase subunit